MDLQLVKDRIAVNVYHIDATKDVALHKHAKHNEVFYCIRGEGYGVLEEGRVALTPGKAFIVPAGTLHSLSSQTNLHVCSFLVPALE